MPNRLAQESSPYLLQHANNPVDWYAWGDEALQRAKRENLPIFLSIGYSACHWCHVMEHESFENATIAAYLNAHFVNIKVDREERPDLDQVYMTAVQLLTGRGGWPMSVFLTPALEPFFGGTYWPPEPRLGMPGFQQVLTAVTDAWTHRQEQAQAQAAQLADHIRRIGAAIPDPATDLGEHQLINAGEALDRVFDEVHGGFGNAPKFPHSMDLQVLLRIHHRAGQEKLLPMVEQTLQKMAQGGIYDHLGGGFARYSVDAKWLVPHFEKMLYDNALLGLAYLEAFQVTRRDLYAQVARETIDYVLRDLQDPSGGFHSTEDADSEGEEGKYYVWTPHEIEQVLGPERASLFCQVYDVTPQGNFEGHNILNLPRSIAQFAAEHGHDGDDLQVELARCRQQLLAVRQGRIRPGKDDKILASWNGLFLETLSRAAIVLQNDLYRDHACRAAEFLQQTMRQPDGRLWHCWRQGEAKVPGFLDDYACVGNGLVTLYQATFDERWLTFATELIDTILQNFRDPAGGGYFFTPDDHEVLIARQKDYHDSSVPSSNGALATFLLRMGTLCGEPRWISEGEQILLSGLEVLERSPMAAGQLLIALDLWLGPRPELLMVGQRKSPTTERALRAIGKAFLPRAAIAFRNVHQIAQGGPLQRAYQGKVGATAEPWLYVCQDFQCRAPLRGLDAILAAF